MDEIEQLLRGTLAGRAEALRTEVGLLERIHRLSRQRQRRRAGLTSLGLGLLAVLAVPLVQAVPDGGRSGTTTAAAPSPIGVALSTVPLALPEFPFRVVRSTIGCGPPRTVISAGRPTLWFEACAAFSLSISAGPTPPFPTTLGRQAQPLEVRGRPATVTEVTTPGGESGWSLYWQERADLWAEIRAVGSVAVAVLRHMADVGLATGAEHVVAPFDFALVPLDMPVDVVTPSTVVFRPEGATPSDDFTGKLVVTMSGADAPAPHGRPLRVGAHAAWLTTTVEGRILRVDLGEGRRLEVQVAAGLPLTDEALVRFAAGIRPTAAARAAAG